MMPPTSYLVCTAVVISILLRGNAAFAASRASRRLRSDSINNHSRFAAVGLTIGTSGRGPDRAVRLLPFFCFPANIRTTGRKPALEKIEIHKARQGLQHALALLDDFETRRTVKEQSSALLQAADAALDAVRHVGSLRHELIQARARGSAYVSMGYHK
jgi:hypothetical protein